MLKDRFSLSTLQNRIPRPKPTEKDSFHNLIFSLTKNSSFVLLTPQPQQDFLFPKGVVDGERPLNFSLAKF
jgi:hypothetical protein